MSLLALVYVLLDRPMQRRFTRGPMFRRRRPIVAGARSEDRGQRSPRGPGAAERGRSRRRRRRHARLTNPNSRTPEVHLLSNGRYHVAISSAGGGYSRWRDLAVTRWREDATRDCWGTFCLSARRRRRESSGRPPSTDAAGQQRLRGHLHASARRVSPATSGLETHTEICVSPEDDIELRRITLTNHSPTTRTIEVTSYAEVVLATQAADEAHPAFSNLFVQTEFLPPSSAILCTRRPRSEEEHPPWLLHLMVGQGGRRVRSPAKPTASSSSAAAEHWLSPAVDKKAAPLSNTAGPVLDPIISLRRTVTAGAEGSADARSSSPAWPRAARARSRSWRNISIRHGRPRLRTGLDAQPGDAAPAQRHGGEAQLYARLAGAIIYADPARRANPGVLLGNRRGQSGLWTYGISGDTPLVLLRITDTEKIEIVRQLVQAHSYWRAKGLAVELVILNEDVSVYRQSLHDQISNLIASGTAAPMLDKPGGIFVRRLEQIPNDDRVLLQSAARIVLDDKTVRSRTNSNNAASSSD